MSNELGYAPGPMGWVIPDATTERQLLDAEKRYFDGASADMPIAYRSRAAKDWVSEAMKAKWEKFQLDKGRFGGSQDLTLIDEFVFGKSLTWLPQDIGSCFPAGTMIRMADGSHKRIEQVRLFEQVLTAEGNIGYISQIGGREVDEVISVVKLWGHQRIKMTQEHPLLTKRGYVKASDLRIDDYVSIPKYAPNAEKYLHTHLHATLNAQVARKVKQGQTTYDHKTTSGYVRVYRSVPDVIELNYDFGWLAGIYLAEGNSDKNKLVWTFHPKEYDTLAARTVELWQALFGVEASRTMQKQPGKRNADGSRQQKDKTCKVSVHSIAWASMFESLFGIGSGGKRLHAEIASGNTEFLKGVLDGWLAGDGSRSKREDFVQGTTISKALALDMHAIANALGMVPTIQSCQPALSHGVESRQARYDVFMRDRKEPMQCEVDDKTVWRKVKGIEQEHFAGRVYNFEVQGDNSYVADGIGVHNCVWSNTFRRWFERMCVEIALRGDAEEFLGTDEYGPESLAPFCVSYGFARQRANMRSGDGLYCSPMQESLVKDGVVLCSTPKLIELMNAIGSQDPRNYPEPRSAALYRKIGNWAWNEALKPYTSCRLLESPKITNIDQHNANVAALKPMFMCSMIAIRPVGTHQDGFPIHARDTRTSWAHNMGWAGVRVASDGKRYHRLCNTSWLQGGTSDVEKFIYNIEESILDGWYRSGKIDVGTIGEIDGIPSLPESI